jgi:hypothetical protein
MAICTFITITVLIKFSHGADSWIVHHLAPLFPFNHFNMTQRIGAIDISANLNPVDTGFSTPKAHIARSIATINVTMATSN